MPFDLEASVVELALGAKPSGDRLPCREELDGFVDRFGDGRSDDVRERLVELFDEPDEGELDERGALGGEAELEDGPLAGAADDVAEGCGELREDHRAPPFRKRGSP